MSADSMENRNHPLRGFAAMVAAGRGDEVRAIAAKGGKAAQAAGTGHTFTTEEAKRAGRRGGLEAQRRGREAKEAEPEKETGT